MASRAGSRRTFGSGRRRSRKSSLREPRQRRVGGDLLAALRSPRSRPNAPASTSRSSPSTTGRGPRRSRDALRVEVCRPGSPARSALAAKVWFLRRAAFRRRPRKSRRPHRCRPGSPRRCPFRNRPPNPRRDPGPRPPCPRRYKPSLCLPRRPRRHCRPSQQLRLHRRPLRRRLLPRRWMPRSSVEPCSSRYSRSSPMSASAHSAAG